ncbi:hypothetical protein D5S17_10855 [Pseudonocardiaceae bacterium YIM PH 21723]|nr:hypothetical protein D5S17_10855 [Pseudonocardiaceae bacterium YIM PH 21723]
MTAVTVTRDWSDIVCWLARNAPLTCASLALPAPRLSTEDLTSMVGRPIPVELAEYWRVVGGTVGEVIAEIFPPYYSPLSLDSALHTWRVYSGTREGHDHPASLCVDDLMITAGRRCWDPMYLPIAHDGCGGYLVVNLRAGSDYGSVLEYDQELGCQPSPAWGAITELMEQLATGLSAGRTERGFRPRTTTCGRLAWECERRALSTGSVVAWPEYLTG